MTKFGAADLAAQLRKDIHSGVLAWQERLPAERGLAQTHGIARGTVREALITLEREGLVEIRRGSGTFVSFQNSVDASDAIVAASPHELLDTRIALEPHICRLAVLKGRQSDFDRLEQLCHRMDDCAEDPHLFAATDRAFHLELATITGNAIMLWVIEQINAGRARDEWNAIQLPVLDADLMREKNQQHRDILSALRSRDPENAAISMSRHLEAARQTLNRSVKI